MHSCIRWGAKAAEIMPLADVWQAMGYHLTDLPCVSPLAMPKGWQTLTLARIPHADRQDRASVCWLGSQCAGQCQRYLRLVAGADDVQRALQGLLSQALHVGACHFAVHVAQQQVCLAHLQPAAADHAQLHASSAAVRLS